MLMMATYNRSYIELLPHVLLPRFLVLLLHSLTLLPVYSDWTKHCISTQMSTHMHAHCEGETDGGGGGLMNEII